ncbi:hypothetical protein ACSQ67_020147 [Phaseolus vulgaris]
MENIASSKQCTCRSRASSFSHSVRVFDQSQPHHHRPPALIRTLTHLGIHQEIIKVPLRLPLLLSFHLSHQHSFSLFTSCFPMQDRVRTETYREAIMQSFIAGKDVEIDEEVDVIISEWMGYMSSKLLVDEGND